MRSRKQKTKKQKIEKQKKFEMTFEKWFEIEVVEKAQINLEKDQDILEEDSLAVIGDWKRLVEAESVRIDGEPVKEYTMELFSEKFGHHLANYMKYRSKQRGFANATHQFYKDNLFKYKKLNIPGSDSDEVGKRLNNTSDYYRLADGSVIYIEQFDIPCYQNKKDMYAEHSEKFPAGEIGNKPISKSLTISIYKADKNGQVTCTLLQHKMFVMDKICGDELFDSDDEHIVQRYDRSLRDVEEEIKTEINTEIASMRAKAEPPKLSPFTKGTHKKIQTSLRTESSIRDPLEDIKSVLDTLKPFVVGKSIDELGQQGKEHLQKTLDKTFEREKEAKKDDHGVYPFKVARSVHDLDDTETVHIGQFETPVERLQDQANGYELSYIQELADPTGIEHSFTDKSYGDPKKPLTLGEGVHGRHWSNIFPKHNVVVTAEVDVTHGPDGNPIKNEGKFPTGKNILCGVVGYDVSAHRLTGVHFGDFLRLVKRNDDQPYFKQNEQGDIAFTKAAQELWNDAMGKWIDYNKRNKTITNKYHLDVETLINDIAVQHAHSLLVWIKRGVTVPQGILEGVGVFGRAFAPLYQLAAAIALKKAIHDLEDNKPELINKITEYIVSECNEQNIEIFNDVFSCDTLDNVNNLMDKYRHRMQGNNKEVFRKYLLETCNTKTPILVVKNDTKYISHTLQVNGFNTGQKDARDLWEYGQFWEGGGSGEEDTARRTTAYLTNHHQLNPKVIDSKQYVAIPFHELGVNVPAKYLEEKIGFQKKIKTACHVPLLQAEQVVSTKHKTKPTPPDFSSKGRKKGKAGSQKPPLPPLPQFQPSKQTGHKLAEKPVETQSISLTITTEVKSKQIDKDKIQSASITKKLSTDGDIRIDRFLRRMIEFTRLEKIEQKFSVIIKEELRIGSRKKKHDNTPEEIEEVLTERAYDIGTENYSEIKRSFINWLNEHPDLIDDILVFGDSAERFGNLEFGNLDMYQDSFEEFAKVFDACIAMIGSGESPSFEIDAEKLGNELNLLPVIVDSKTKQKVSVDENKLQESADKKEKKPTLTEIKYYIPPFTEDQMARTEEQENIVRLFSAFDEEKRFEKYPLNCEGLAIPPEMERRIFSAVTRKQKQSFLIDSIVTMALKKRENAEFIRQQCDNLKESPLKYELISRLPIEVHHSHLDIKNGDLNDRNRFKNYSSIEPKLNEPRTFYGITGSTYTVPPELHEKVSRADIFDNVYYEETKGGGFTLAIADGCGHPKTKAQGSKNLHDVTEYVAQTAAKMMRDFDNPDDLMAAMSEGGSFIKTLNDKAIESSNTRRVFDDPARTTLSIGRAYKTGGDHDPYRFVGFSHGKTMFVAIDTATGKIRELAPAIKSATRFTDSFPMQELTKPYIFNEKLESTEYVVGLTDGIFDELKCTKTEIVTTENIVQGSIVSLDCAAINENDQFKAVPPGSQIDQYLNVLRNIAVDAVGNKYKLAKELEERWDERAKNVNELNERTEKFKKKKYRPLLNEKNFLKDLSKEVDPNNFENLSKLYSLTIDKILQSPEKEYSKQIRSFLEFIKSRFVKENLNEEDKKEFTTQLEACGEEIKSKVGELEESMKDANNTFNAKVSIKNLVKIIENQRKELEEVPQELGDDTTLCAAKPRPVSQLELRAEVQLEHMLTPSFKPFAEKYARKLREYARSRRNNFTWGENELRGYTARRAVANNLARSLEGCKTSTELEEIVASAVDYGTKLEGTNSDLQKLIKDMQYEAGLILSLQKQKQPPPILPPFTRKPIREVNRKQQLEQRVTTFINEPKTFQETLANPSLSDEEKVRYCKAYLSTKIDETYPADDQRKTLQKLRHSKNISAKRIRKIEAKSMEEFIRILRTEYKALKTYELGFVKTIGNPGELGKVIHDFLEVAQHVKIPRPISHPVRHFADHCAYTLLNYIDKREREIGYKANLVRDNLEDPVTNRLTKAGEFAHQLLKCETKEDLYRVIGRAQTYANQLENDNVKSELITIIQQMKNKLRVVEELPSNRLLSTGNFQPTMKQAWQTTQAKTERVYPKETANIDVIISDNTREKLTNYLAVIKEKLADKVNRRHYLYALKKAYKDGVIGKKLYHLLESKDSDFIKNMSTNQLIDLLFKTAEPTLMAEQHADQKKINAGWIQKERELLGALIKKVTDVTVHTRTSFKPTPEDFIEDIGSRPTCDMVFINGPVLNTQTSIDWHLVLNKDGMSVNREKYKRLLLDRLLPGLIDASHSHPEGVILTSPAIGGGAFAGEFGEEILKLFPELFKEIVNENIHRLSNIKAIVYTEGKEGSLRHLDKSCDIPFITTPDKIGFCPKLYPDLFEGVLLSLDVFNKCSVTALIAGDHFALPGNDYWRGSPMTIDGAALAYTNLAEKITNKDMKIISCQSFPQDHTIWDKITTTLDAGNITSIHKINPAYTPLYTLALDLFNLDQDTTNAPDFDALRQESIQQARMCAMTIALCKSKNHSDRELGHELQKNGITPDKIEQSRRENPVCYYAQLCLAGLSQVKIDKTHIRNELEKYINDILAGNTSADDFNWSNADKQLAMDYFNQYLNKKCEDIRGLEGGFFQSSSSLTKFLQNFVKNELPELKPKISNLHQKVIKYYSKP